MKVGTSLANAKRVLQTSYCALSVQVSPDLRSVETKTISRGITVLSNSQNYVKSLDGMGNEIKGTISRASSTADIETVSQLSSTKKHLPGLMLRSSPVREEIKFDSSGPLGYWAFVPVECGDVSLEMLLRTYYRRRRRTLMIRRCSRAKETSGGRVSV